VSFGHAGFKFAFATERSLQEAVGAVKSEFDAKLEALNNRLSRGRSSISEDDEGVIPPAYKRLLKEKAETNAGEIALMHQEAQHRRERISASQSLHDARQEEANKKATWTRERMEDRASQFRLIDNVEEKKKRDDIRLVDEEQFRRQLQLQQSNQNFALQSMSMNLTQNTHTNHFAAAAAYKSHLHIDTAEQQ
jgi:hypothetical protein